MRALALLLVLAAPGALAVSFEVSVEDPPDDVRAADGRPLAFPTADILRLTSAQEGDRIVQRVEVASPPRAPGDSILVRTWFQSSTNGSFHTVDLVVRGDAPSDARFRPVLRDGAFENVTPIEGARYGVENATWVFSFDAALLANATCFDPGAFTEHGQRAGFRGFDEAYVRGTRACATAREPEPEPATPPPPPTPSAPPPSPSTLPPPPGSDVPTPAPGAWAALVAGALALTLRRSARRS